ncbi:ABC-type Fe3+/spermidine/putrescine transport system ATPase subunit [Rhizobium leguminosarum]|uniref:ABC-type Fe3+/spermidine/putrescine transport system ATPase subunit n=1 Tax=Rhizobium leguminosarum TaxID=384 RepID=A0AAE2SX50_RHILE|nr:MULTISPECIES: ABC transporter ATP-binding protein [Rhizobium]MBB4291432.1 ABC-type Fe3+/spermidine/putrescine transport system ATPase subunit [Rhizobium leguminosarum]MBB4296128.1 ABC-type Fe3+/spermidine/putrescine transport system ATPase subunit [Rhizobium leguminosarum]MBB4308613.1 ABC-type Fe3+/spermidine/putrescine transport system ATPase subunit [Rhizobium leguminosarum]MBB4416448.1 ABC-type Fe3+/spermidine/putrescine transport system ATPase subunit [Rhizobium leguminosarum]MBB4430585
MSDIQVELKDVSFKYDGTARGGIDRLNLQIGKGEFVSLLGQSGCGKTTTLKLVAGLLNASTGKISVNGTDVTRVGPEKRNISMVFQNYALFPHMDVFENVGFGLKMKQDVPLAERKARVENVLDLIGLQDFKHKHPKELSGGQQQRVGLARAIVTEPDVMLLDEPLSNLDAQLRENMCVELMNLQRKLKLSVLYVTHDRAEALSMSNRIAVMDGGCIVEIDSPNRLYRYPEYVVTAKTLGEANVWPIANFPNTCLSTMSSEWAPDALSRGDSLMVRPEDVSLRGTAAEGAVQLKAEVVSIVYRGDQYRIGLELPDFNLKALCTTRADTELQVAVGDTVPISVEYRNIRVLRAGSPGGAR